MSIPSATTYRNRLTFHIIDGDWTYSGSVNANTTVTSGIVKSSPVINCGAVGDIVKSPRYGYTLSGGMPVGNPAQMAANAAADVLAAAAANSSCFLATNKLMTQAGFNGAIGQGFATEPSIADIFALVRDGTHSASAIAAKARLSLFLTPFVAAIGSVRPTGIYSNDEEIPIYDMCQGNGAAYIALYNSWLADPTMQARIAALRARGVESDRIALDALVRIAWNTEIHWMLDALAGVPIIVYFFGKAAPDCYRFRLDTGGTNSVGISELDGSGWSYQAPTPECTARLIGDLASKRGVLTVPVMDIHGFVADSTELIKQWTALKNEGVNDALLFVNQGQAGYGADLTAAASALADAQGPRMLPPYSGPMTDMLYPSAVTVLTATARNWTNSGTLVGAPDGGLASATVPMVSASDPSDKLKLAYTPPAGLTNANILGWKFRFESISGVRSDAGAWEKGRCGAYVQPLDATNVRRGQPEGYHEYPGSPASNFWQYQEYAALELSNFNQDNWTIFTSSSGGAVGVKCNTFADWPGFALWLDEVSGTNVGYNTTVSLDTLGVIVAYTPPDPGTSIALTTSATPVMAGISAAAAGIALEGAWGSEVGWTSITNARVVDLSRATADGVGGLTPELANQTQFIPYYFGSGQIAAAVGKTPCQIRLPIQCRFEDESGLAIAGEIAYATLAEVALFSCNGDGSLNALICKASDRPLYDQTNWKIGMHFNAATTSERIRVACLDISGISQANLTSMNTNGFAVLIRWRMSQPANSDGGAPTPSHLVVNGVVSPTLSYIVSTARPIARTTRVRRMARLTRR